MPRLTKQQKPPARPPVVNAVAMTVHAKRVNAKPEGKTGIGVVAGKHLLASVPGLLADLADCYGIKPSDVPGFPLTRNLLLLAGIDPAQITLSQLNQSGGIWRAGIADSMRRVDALNTAILQRIGDDNRVAEGGDVRTLQRRAEPEVVETNPPVDKPRKNGLEILGLPAGYLLQAMGRAGFSVSAARAAFDELGGMGVSDSTIRVNLQRGVAEDFAALTAEQLVELEPFRNAKPEPRPEQERLPHVVVPPRSVKTLD